jgi:eukaryotic-like serine/threonine-protein kinase
VRQANEIEVPSQRFGHYKVKSRLGQGGMAEVFLAEAVDQQGDQLTVALKLMKKGGDEVAFLEEADLMGLLIHPNLVQRLEVGHAFGRPFIAMEYLIGGDLQGVMNQHKKSMKGFPTAMGVHVVIEVLRGLAYFHTARTRSGQPLNLVHSDVNPANVFFAGTGEVKVGDFGVASSTHTGLSLAEGVTAGKLGYLSPEQTRGESLSNASDLWAVGVMLHELVVGYHPFRKDGASEDQVMSAIRSARLSLPDYVDKPLAGIIQRSLAGDLRARYRTAGELAGALFSYGLDNNLLQTRDRVQEWLQGELELVV